MTTRWQEEQCFSTSLGGEITIEAKVLRLPRSGLYYTSREYAPRVTGSVTSEDMGAALGDYHCFIPFEDLYPPNKPFLVAGKIWSFFWKVPGSPCDLHSLDWVQEVPGHTDEIFLVLLGTWQNDQASVLLLARNASTGKFTRVDSGRCLLERIDSLTSILGLTASEIVQSFSEYQEMVLV